MPDNFKPMWQGDELYDAETNQRLGHIVENQPTGGGWDVFVCWEGSDRLLIPAHDATIARKLLEMWWMVWGVTAPAQGN